MTVILTIKINGYLSVFDTSWLTIRITMLSACFWINLIALVSSTELSAKQTISNNMNGKRNWVETRSLKSTKNPFFVHESFCLNLTVEMSEPSCEETSHALFF